MRAKVFSVWEANILALQRAMDYCAINRIKGYRISSGLFPKVDHLLAEGVIAAADLARYHQQLAALETKGLLLSMHPGQHVNLGSPTPEVVANSLADLRYHFGIARAVGAGEVNIHLGGVYGDKEAALARFTAVVQALPAADRALLTVENDELNYSIDEVVTVAATLGLRVVYDIHHQRCHELKYAATGSEWDYFCRARASWPAEQMQRLHLSSPRDGFGTVSSSRPHSDYIDREDIPDWLAAQPVLVDIEAKAKELAIKQMKNDVKGL